MYKIGDNCVACHNCAMECPRQAIRYVGLKYEIDQDQCIECGLCAKVCHISNITDVDHPEAPVPHDPVELECDVLVCGGGTGLVAAVRAAQAGKKVIVLEAAKKLGGNTDYAHGYFPVHCVLHRRHGLPDCSEEAVEFYYSLGEGKVDKELIRTAVYGCSQYFDWLVENCPESADEVLFEPLPRPEHRGVSYSNAWFEFITRRWDNLLCRDNAIGPGWGGTHTKMKMLKLIEKQSLDVTIYLETRARHLLLDDAGAVCGVVASDPGGEVRVRAKAVVLSTGGFGRSDEKMERYCPQLNFFTGKTPVVRFSVPTDRGDAIDMLQELGVEPDPEKMFCSMWGPAHHPFSWVVMQVAGGFDTVQVNAEGRRWIAEQRLVLDQSTRLAIRKQPREISWTIMTQEMIDRNVEEWRQRSPHDAWKFEYVQYDLDDEQTFPADSVTGAPVRKADTLEELAEKIQVPVNVFMDTMNRYNQYCRQGKDEEFGKPAEFLAPIEQGPFYAIYGQCFSEAAMGGLRVTPKCQVTREDGTVIPGLYGTGDATSAMHRKDGLAPVGELTWAVASTYVAGGEAAAYVDALA